ncbi:MULTISPECIES: sodium:solute symporter [unclassified Paenibacillus]|uniref:sodium:solute symporter family protein n=1 Tax=unclassified Paenibacillus TaxID=185978 RepID=UPI002117F225|nr:MULTISPECIES: sodium:solute symporter family protein [unclassified Paenibacillus]
MEHSLLYLLYFLFYSIVLLWFGKYGFDRVKSSKDYFIGHGNMGVFLGVCTFCASWISATSMLFITGSVYRFGLYPSVFGVLGWFAGALLFIPLTNRLAHQSLRKSLRTLPEYFYVRYGCRRLQAVGGMAVVFSHLFYIMLQIRGFGLVVGHMLEIPYALAVLLVYLFLIYTTFGGFESVARTDMVNFLLILIGSFTGAILVYQELGGSLHTAQKFVSASISLPQGIPSPMAADRSSLFYLGMFMFMSWALGKSTYPQYMNRVLAAKDRSTAVKMIGISLILLVATYAVLIFTSLGIRALSPELAAVSLDEIMPMAVERLFAPYWAGLILTAIMAAAVSTANSQLLVLAGSFSWDIYRYAVKRPATEEKLIRVSRWLVTIGATVSLLMAFIPPGTLLDYSSYIWGFFAATFFVPLYGGLFWKGATKEGAWAGFVGGTSIYIMEILFFRLEGEWTNPALPGVLVSLLCLVTVSTFYRRKRNRKNEEDPILTLH